MSHSPVFLSSRPDYVKIFQSLPSILLSAQSPDTYEKVWQWQPQLTWSNDTQQMLIPRSTSNSFTAFMMSSWRLERAPSGAFVLHHHFFHSLQFSLSLYSSLHSVLFRLIVYYMKNTYKYQGHKGIHGTLYSREDRHGTHNYLCLIK